MASSFDDDDDFDEYNPHPYQGGYNIALTYGSPLPPSSATCYSIDGVFPASSSSPPPPVRSLDGDDAVVVPDQTQQVDLGFPWYDHLAFGSFGFGRGWDYAEENSHWRPLRRALDYLFGYSQGFGERRIGVDSYGIPIYANKKPGAEMALSVQVQPAINQKIEFHEWPLVNGEESAESAEIETNPNESSFHAYENHGNENYYGKEISFYDYDNRGNESSFYAYENHHYEEPAHVQFREQVVPSWSWDAYNHKDYMEQGSEDESYSYGNLIYAYDKQQYEQPLSVEVQPAEHGWVEQLEYHEVYEEQPSFESSNWYSSSYGEWGTEMHASENSHYDYERTNYFEQPEYSELEPYEPTWSQFPGYLQDYKDEVPHESNKGDDPTDIVMQLFSPFRYPVYDV
ncbi:hypothetical protein IHE45_12G056700 [Dioscorea alata]|uniref:Uncharacterized protein n=1 Tax=Dioscorea alata TaxID=55571 RepID=A0ACB7V2F3_DIOAL|nr:hypothetical protein IHE45_12G056700 [Dioscorea alata]